MLRLFLVAEAVLFGGNVLLPCAVPDVGCRLRRSRAARRQGQRCAGAVHACREHQLHRRVHAPGSGGVLAGARHAAGDADADRHVRQLRDGVFADVGQAGLHPCGIGYVPFPSQGAVVVELPHAHGLPSLVLYYSPLPLHKGRW